MMAVEKIDGLAFVAPMAESGRKPCTGKAVSCRVPAQTSGLILSPLLVLLVIGRSEDGSSKFLSSMLGLADD